MLQIKSSSTNRWISIKDRPSHKINRKKIYKDNKNKVISIKIWTGKVSSISKWKDS